MKPTRDKQPASKLAGRDQARQAEGERDGGAEHEAFAAPARKKGLGGKARSAESPLQANSGSFLDGQLLIAMPGMSDERFARSVIYMCAHSAEGAMGIMLNRPSSVRNFPELLEQLRVIDSAERISLPPAARDVQVLSGGPVQTDRGFVLHEPAGNWQSTLRVRDLIGLTTSKDILEAVGRGEGPRRLLVTLGYAGWSPGQLEHELSQNAWLTVEARDGILFETPAEERLPAAMELLGLDFARLQDEAGHA